MSVWEVLHGDCIEVMRTLPADSVDAVITSPPYAMQRKATYGGVPESDYPAWTVAWMAEVRRLLKRDGSAIINIRPHIKNGQISDYVLRTRLALRAVGWNECEELIWNKISGPPLGHVNRPRRSWESLHWFAKHGRPYCDPRAAGGPPVEKRARQMSGRARTHGWGHVRDTQVVIPLAERSRVTDVIAVSVRKNEDDSPTNKHPAPYPPDLAEWCGQLICPPGGTVLDPFSGSASTGVAAIRNGWDYIGIDAVEEYVDMSRRRLAVVALEEGSADIPLFDDDGGAA